MVRVHRHNHWSWFAHAVSPVERGPAVGVPPGTEDLLTLARGGGALGERFAQFTRENLCMESWDFIVDAIRYQKVRECRGSSFFLCRSSPLRLIGSTRRVQNTRQVKLRKPRTGLVSHSGRRCSGVLRYNEKRSSTRCRNSAGNRALNN